MNEQIDIKSLLIGTLLTATIFLGVAATSPTDKWDDKQQWLVDTKIILEPRAKKDKMEAGWEPFGSEGLDYILVRKRVK